MPQDAASPSRPVASRAGRTLRILALVGLVVLLLWCGLSHLLLWLGRNLALPMLQRALAGATLEVDLRRLDLAGLETGMFRLGTEGGLRWRAARVDWTLPGVLRGRLDRVELLGVEIQPAHDERGWHVPGLDFSSAPGHGGNRSFIRAIAEVTAQGQILLPEETRLVIPFSGHGRLDPHLLEFHSSLIVAGQELALTLEADPKLGSGRLAFQLPQLSLARLTALFPKLNVPVSGHIAADLEALLSPQQFPRLHGRVHVDSAVAAFDFGRIAQKGRLELNFSWEDSPAFSLSPLFLESPWPMVLTVRKPMVAADLKSLSCSWEAAWTSWPGMALEEPLLIKGDLHGARSTTGWMARLTGESQAFQGRWPGFSNVGVHAEPLSFVVEINHEDVETKLHAVISAPKLTLTRDSVRADLKGLRLEFRGSFDAASHHARVVFSVAGLEGDVSGFSMTGTELTGHVDAIFQETMSINALLDATLRARFQETIAEVGLHLPLSWPDPSSKAGRLDLTAAWKNVDLARIDGVLKQNKAGLDLDGTIFFPLVKGRGSVKAHVSPLVLQESTLQIRAFQKISLPADLARLFPGFKNMIGTAVIDLQANLHAPRGVPEIPLRFHLQDVNVRHPSSQTTLIGGTLTLNFDDLLTFRSKPNQELGFSRLQLGAVHLERADIRYQVEGKERLFVEGGRLEWAGGRIGVHAFRINPAMQDVSIELYCDRVQLAQALAQLGVQQVQGDGTVNGRIPLRYHKGALTFDNGFLYSTPGEGGTLRIESAEMLLAGIPKDSSQFGHLDLASEALKDFNYEWAKIRLNTQGELLILTLDLDGKPSRALPFTYRQDLGGFGRVSADSPGSVFQGIRLNVNFRLPLDRILQYRRLYELIKQGG
ncbi:MAG: YdbH domain-containing protein [Desulfosoma sp.]